eukprot:4720137-Amphidinium_carterae.1
MQADTSMCAMLTTHCYVQRKLKRDTKASGGSHAERRDSRNGSAQLLDARVARPASHHTQPQDC